MSFKEVSTLGRCSIKLSGATCMYVSFKLGRVMVWVIGERVGKNIGDCECV